MHLIEAREQDVITLMTWFSDRDSAQRWGGPNLRFPFNEGDFRQDIRWGEIDTYSLIEDQQMLAFGQVYTRNGRHHLGRLVVAPEARGRSLGRRLIEEILGQAQQHDHRAEASLFVYRDNLPAWHCYTQLGFRAAPFPTDMPPLENGVFMIKPLEGEPPPVKSRRINLIK